MMTDTINDLLECENWNHEKVLSDYHSKILMAKPTKEDVPYARARELSVNLPIEDRGKTDVFIDDIISVAPDLNGNLERLRAASCSVLHAFAHKAYKSSKSVIPRDDLRTDDQNEAEGAPEEVKICLGWTLDSRSLLVRLPFHKYTAWKQQIVDALKKKSVVWKMSQLFYQ